MEGLVAEAAKRGEVDLSVVSIDSTSPATGSAARWHSS